MSSKPLVDLQFYHTHCLSPFAPFSGQNSAQRALQESEKLFAEMLRSIERMQQEMSKLITSNKKAALNNAEGHMDRLTHEISDLKRRDDELTALSRTEDHIHFIQVTDPPVHQPLQNITVELTGQRVWITLKITQNNSKSL